MTTLPNLTGFSHDYSVPKLPHLQDERNLFGFQTSKSQALANSMTFKGVEFLSSKKLPLLPYTAATHILSTGYQKLRNVVILSYMTARATPHILSTGYQHLRNVASLSYMTAANTLRNNVWLGAGNRLNHSPDRSNALQLAEDLSGWLNSLASSTNKSDQQWYKLVDILNSNNNLSHLNHIIHAVAVGGKAFETLMTAVNTPKEVKAFVKAQQGLLAESRVIKRWNVGINLLSESSQACLMKCLPLMLPRYGLNAIKSNYLPQLPNAEMQATITDNNVKEEEPAVRDTVNNEPNVDAGSGAEGASSEKSKNENNVRIDVQKVIDTGEISDADLSYLGDKLWVFTADLMHAARLEEPDPEKLEDAKTPIIPVPTQRQSQLIRAELKGHLSIFEPLIYSKNPEEAFESMLEKAKLPNSIRQSVEEAFFKELKIESDQGADGQVGASEEDNARHKNNLFGILRNIGPLMTQEQKEGIIDSIPDSVCLHSIGFLNKMLQSIDPYKELDFYKKFSDDLVKAIKEDTIKTLAERLTQKYFPAMNGSIEFQRSLAVAVMRVGRDAKMGDRIHELGQAAGIGFQKGMQELGDKVEDPAIREPLNRLKEGVKKMSFLKATNIIKEELEVLNTRSDKIEYKIINIEEKSRAATIGQVHKATLIQIDRCSREKISEKTVALKVKRDGAQRRFAAERQGLNEALRVPEQEEETRQEAATRETVDTLMEGFERELDFVGGEREYGRMASALYRGEKNGVTIKGAAPIEATDNLLIQEWAHGSNIDEQLIAIDKAIADVDNQSGHETENGTVSEADRRKKRIELHRDKINLLCDLKSGLELMTRVWLLGFIDGGKLDDVSVRYMDSDRHSGNDLYDPDNKVLTMLDFGAGKSISDAEKRALVGVLISVVTRNVNATYDNLSKLVPRMAKEGGRDEGVIEGIRSVMNNDYRLRIIDPVNRMLEKGIITDKALADELKSGELDSSDNNGYQLILKGRTGCLGRLQRGTKKHMRQADAAIQLIEARESKELTAEEKIEIRTLFDNPQRVAMNLRKNPLNPAADNDNAVFVIKALERIANVLNQEGFVPPTTLIMMNRGYKFLTDRMVRLNTAIEKETAAVKSAGYTAKEGFDKMIEPIKVGNLFIWTLKMQTPHALSEMARQVGVSISERVRQAGSTVYNAATTLKAFRS